MNTHFPEEADKHFVIRADAEAIAAIMRLKVFDKLAHTLSLSEGAILFHKVLSHKKSWIVAMRYCGFKKTEENGYLVVGWPKKEFPASVMDEYILGVTNQPGLIKVIDTAKIRRDAN